MSSAKKPSRPGAANRTFPSAEKGKPERRRGASMDEASGDFSQILENSLEGLEFSSGKRGVGPVAPDSRRSRMFASGQKNGGSVDDSGKTASLRVSPEDLRREMEKIKQELKAKKAASAPDAARLKVTSDGNKKNKEGESEEGPRLTSSDIFGALIDDIESGRVKEEEFTAAGQNRISDPAGGTGREAEMALLAEEGRDDQIFSTQPLPQLSGEDIDGGQAGAGRGRGYLDTAHASGTNQYQLISKIAAGGMAEVWKAKLIGEKGFEKIVAIKKILPHLGDNEEFISMFIDEAKVAANLTHPNIAQIYELGKMADSFFIAMEYVSGHNLRTLFNISSELGVTMPPEVAAFIGMKLCNALHYAHNKKGYDNLPLHIVHRDVSPQNILVSTEGEIKLVDFGIAKASIKATETIAGSLKGKLLYMSPEQADGKPIDKRSDIFSLGNLLFEALTGRKLFLGDSELSILKSVREARIPRLREINPAIPPGLEEILLKALSRDPDQRYEDAKALENALKEFLKREKIHINESEVAEFAKLVAERDASKIRKLDQGAQAPPPKRRPPVVLPDASSAAVLTSRPSGPAGGGKTKLVVALVVLVALAALATWLFLSRGEPVPTRSLPDTGARTMPPSATPGETDAASPPAAGPTETPATPDGADQEISAGVGEGDSAPQSEDDEELKRLEEERQNKLEELRKLRERTGSKDPKKDNG